ncbi:NUDIX domain-containing protein [Pseudonocardia broussonetiae]|uniref:NUDIX domain-containing protein n=2 Tax=Pseudonocardia broussonetiae TaxID=2736640 RepID=A0A6M6JSQ7_9PSEU|nr:NUDIX domain-containing protein [Pseudonocardia broussonetiae]
MRVGAYVLCVRDGAVLLVRFTRSQRWTLPGGGLDHAEDPRAAAVREVAEETGLEVRLGELLHVDSTHWSEIDGRPADVHALRILYTGEITGGELRDEVGGSSDHAEWVALADLPGLDRSRMIDIAIGAADELRVRPAVPPR